MRYAFFTGCQTPARLPQYEHASRLVLGRLGVDLVDCREFTCCGYPLRNVDQKAFLLSAARNMAIAERDGRHILVLCQCGFGTFKEAQYQLKGDTSLKEEINRLLGQQGLSYEGRVEVTHILSVLYHAVGREALNKAVTIQISGLKVAAHYGCHALRPSRITGFDDPIAPSLFDELIRITGAESVGWSEKLNCCGAPLTGVNDPISSELTRNKIRSGIAAGAHCLCTACPYCQLQFDQVQRRLLSEGRLEKALPSILYPQLLGLCMGIRGEDLGLKQNYINIDPIRSFL
ncbi:MAG: disulfide reductase [Desulfococcus sp. 4484_242]|nr:MAG: disulfide reductase [Desulfococcus sp. 4484_242]